MTLGGAIRKQRTNARLRLIDVAAKTQFSPSYLSQIERDKVCPSVAALARIAEALDTSVGALFEATEATRHRISPVVRRTRRKIFVSPDSPTRNGLLTPRLNGALEVLWSRIPRGAKSPVMQHDGEECGVILKGTLVYWVGEERYVLRAGDSITFKCHIPHRYENQSGRVVESIWATTPPSF